MPKTIDKTAKGQTIGGIFNNLNDADNAVKAFAVINIPPKDIAVVSQLDGVQAKETYALLAGHGFSETKAAHYEKLMREGKVLVVVNGVTDPASVIDIFDKYNGQYDPDGSRNPREDVSGMTAGAVIGAAAGGTIGAIVAGPVGIAVGGVAGEVVGAGTGAAAGKAAEHHK